MPETGIFALMKLLLRFLLMMVFGIAGSHMGNFLMTAKPAVWISEIAHPYLWSALCIILFALVGFMLAHPVWWALKKICSVFENTLQNVSLSDIIATVTGLAVSLVLANLLAIPFRDIPVFGFYIATGLNITFAFVGMVAFMRKRDEIWQLVTGLGAAGRASSQDGAAVSPGIEPVAPASAVRKVLDTSALIDGRILDIASTGFIDGVLILPRFVLTELQGVADSADGVRRARGRKGLSVVSELQKSRTLAVQIEDTTMRELRRDKVDEALVELCKRLDAKIVTTDFNLNQIARIEGVSVLNVNELSNSLKPHFLPGDVISADIIKHGKDRGQGVGYLDDGTMLVVEDGEGSIGETREVVISSMLQTSSGRMVFGKLKR